MATTLPAFSNNLLVSVPSPGPISIIKSSLVIFAFSTIVSTTLSLIKAHPDYFAAAYPICPAGSISEEEAKTLVDLPIWFIHAKNDDTVNVKGTEQSIANLIAAGNENVHVSYFDDVHDTTGRFDDEDGNPYQYSGHWSWVYAFNDEVTCDEDGTNLWAWMNAQAKKAPLTPDQPGTEGGATGGNTTGGTTTNPTKPNVGIYNNAAYVAVATVALAGAAYVAFKKKED